MEGVMTHKEVFILLVGCFFFSGCSSTPDRSLRSQTANERHVKGELVVLPTRPGVTQGILILRPVGKAKGSILLFMGGEGAGAFSEAGDGFILGGNFLIRSAPLFVRQDFVAVIVDTPSDNPFGISQSFRKSPQHLRDIQAVVSHLVEKGDTPIFLAGTSRGTHSVAYLAQRMTEGQIKGVILTSSMYNLGFEATNFPVLFVHHQDDACRVTAHAGAWQWYENVYSPRKAFVTVRGGDPDRGRVCGAFAKHGFIGKEKDVVQVITDWAQGTPILNTIGP